MAINLKTLSKTRVLEVDMEVIAGYYETNNFLLNPATGYTPSVYDMVVLNDVSGEHELLDLDEFYIVDESITLVASTADLTYAIDYVTKVTNDAGDTVYTPSVDYIVSEGGKAVTALGTGSIGATDTIKVTYSANIGKEIVGMILEEPVNNNTLMYTKSEMDGYINIDKVSSKGGVDNLDADNKKFLIDALRKINITAK